MGWSTFPSVKVGDPLILVRSSRYRADERVTVSRVGRTWLYVKNDQGTEKNARFSKTTGLEDTGTGAKDALQTQEQYDEAAQRRTLFRDLREAGIEINKWSVQDDLTTEQLRQLLAVVKPEGS
ncbi:beta barrel domain-containing protein [Streptomyces sp. MH60]|uniref:beta barrel domain-containing protein n=1 Tax=Streptomyces sp. MH60 TaxID=1940758 RepID=UPI000CEF3A0E|nr:hypothetical protein [Streptomyces sp. MH60]PPS89418.1 hypothetical protein BZZ08_01564 [Streptomyces sp. MH60]